MSGQWEVTHCILVTLPTFPSTFCPPPQPTDECLRAQLFPVPIWPLSPLWSQSDPLLSSGWLFLFCRSFPRWKIWEKPEKSKRKIYKYMSKTPWQSIPPWKWNLPLLPGESKAWTLWDQQPPVPPHSKITTYTYICIYLYMDYIHICILTPLSSSPCIAFHLHSCCLTATVKQPTMRLTWEGN